MAAGIQPTKQQVDEMAGTTVRGIKMAFDRARDFKAWLDGQADADLTALGYSAADIANLRSSYVDIAQLIDIFNGAASLGTPKDFRAFAKRLWGLGVTNTSF